MKTRQNASPECGNCDCPSTLIALHGGKCPRTMPQFLIPMEPDAPDELTIGEQLLVWLVAVVGLCLLAGLGVIAWRAVA